MCNWNRNCNSLYGVLETVGFIWLQPVPTHAGNFTAGVAEFGE